MSDKMHPRFSVVMTVFDNAHELEENLPAYLTQEYEPGYEVIIVDESSTDETDDVLTRFKATHAHLYTTFLPRPNRRVSRYRMALTLGVKAAKNEWIIFADIRHSPAKTWLSELAEYATSSQAMILGYYKNNGDTRLQLFDDIGLSRDIVSKTERRKANGHRGSLLRYLRGKYDFTVVSANRGHDLLRFYELDLRGGRLMACRLRTLLYNMFH